MAMKVPWGIDLPLDPGRSPSTQAAVRVPAELRDLAAGWVG